MTNTSPITPPPELLEHWEDLHFDEGENYDVMLIQAYQAGADQELEACCDWLASKPTSERKIPELRATRRPNPPSLKLQALNDLNTAYNEDAIDDTTYCNIRRALEALND
jgi:hypothetical protein